MTQLSADIQRILKIFEEQIPFNNLLDLKIEKLDLQGASMRVDMRDELVGNFMQGTLHGGVTAAILDVTGGLTAFMGLLEKMGHLSDQEKMERLSKFGTIDLRIDYLRPGRGTYFVSKGSILRTGNKVAVTRMELHNDKKHLIATGTGSYLSV